METFIVRLTFDVGDPETVAKVIIMDVYAPNAALAGAEALAKTVSAKGFGAESLIEVTATRTVPGVKRNLLAVHR